MLLLAQLDSLSGGAGWVGAGLLGAVLAWLFAKHLPDKDRQIKELVDKFLSLLNEKRSEFLKELSEARKEYMQDMLAERETCERRHKENQDAHREVMNAIKETRHIVRNHDEAVSTMLEHIWGEKRKKPTPEQEKRP